MKKILLLTPVIFLCLSVCAEAQQYWQKEFKINGNLDAVSHKIIGTSDNNFIFAGYALHNPLPNYLLLAKINPLGDTLWTRKFAPNGVGPTAYSITNTNDNGVIISGNGANAFLLKYDNLGNFLWYKEYNFYSTTFYKIKQLPDSTILACGNQDYSAIIVKFDKNGNLLWHKIFTDDFFSVLYDFVQVNNKFTFAGTTVAGNFDQFIFFVQLIDTNISFKNNYSIPGNTIINGKKIELLNNYFRIFASTFNKSNGKMNICYVNITQTGNLIGHKVYDNIFTERLNDASSLLNKTIILSEVSETNNTLYAKLTIIDSSGNILKYKTFNNFGFNNLESIYKIDNINFICAGSSAFNSNTDKPFLVKTDTSFFIKPVYIVSNSAEVNFILRQNYPNPFNPTTILSYSLKKSSAIELKLFDIIGRMIKIIDSGFKPAGSYEINFSAEGLTSGVYFFSLYSEGILMDTKKAVVLK